MRAMVLQASVSQQGALCPLRQSQPAAPGPAGSQELRPLSQCRLRAGGWHPGVPFARASLYCADADFSVLAW